jgi:hypothetical protein
MGTSNEVPSPSAGTTRRPSWAEVTLRPGFSLGQLTSAGFELQRSESGDTYRVTFSDSRSSNHLIRVSEGSGTVTLQAPSYRFDGRGGEMNYLLIDPKRGLFEGINRMIGGSLVAFGRQLVEGAVDQSAGTQARPRSE